MSAAFEVGCSVMFGVDAFGSGSGFPFMLESTISTAFASALGDKLAVFSAIFEVV